MRTISSMVLLLNASQLGERFLGIELAFGQDDLEQFADLRDRQGGGREASVHAQPHQEMMREQRHGRVVVPAHPAADFVVIQAQLALAFFNDRLDGPAPGRHARQRGQRRVGGGIRAIELPVLQRGANRPPEHQPLVAAGQLFIRHDHALHGDFNFQWALGAFMNDEALPIGRPQGLGQRVHALSGRGVGGQMAPDLAGRARKGGRDVAWHVRFLKEPAAVFPDSRMPSYRHLSEQELRTLAEFLVTL